jgi:hypothetical protein
MQRQRPAGDKQMRVLQRRHQGLQSGFCGTDLRQYRHRGRLRKVQHNERGVALDGHLPLRRD